jgi:hypothetical protein
MQSSRGRGNPTSYVRETLPANCARTRLSGKHAICLFAAPQSQQCLRSGDRCSRRPFGKQRRSKFGCIDISLLLEQPINRSKQSCTGHAKPQWSAFLAINMWFLTDLVITLHWKPISCAKICHSSPTAWAFPDAHPGVVSARREAFHHARAGGRRNSPQRYPVSVEQTTGKPIKVSSKVALCFTGASIRPAMLRSQFPR